MLTISFDFDGTYAADPKTWTQVVKLLQEAGHICVLCTNRPPEWGDQVTELVGGIMPIVFAGTESKHWAMRNAGYHVDIWIDDLPAYITMEGLPFRGT